MSMDATAIERIQNTAPHTEASKQLEILERNHGTPSILLPKDCRLESLEELMPYRSRFRAALHTSAVEDFTSYYAHNQVADCTQVFVQPESMTAKAIFNLYDEEEIHQPGHGDHTASLTLVKTAPYKALLEIDGGRHSQKALAEWMEDWRNHLAAFASDESPNLNINQAIAAIRRITIEATAKTDTEVRNFGASRSAMESIEAKSEDQLPAFPVFTCQPYKGLEERSFSLRVGVLTGDKAPVLATRIIKLEEHQEAMAEEFKTLLKTCLPEEAKIYIGSFNLKP